MLNREEESQNGTRWRERLDHLKRGTKHRKKKYAQILRLVRYYQLVNIKFVCVCVCVHEIMPQTKFDVIINRFGASGYNLKQSHNVNNWKTAINRCLFGYIKRMQESWNLWLSCFDFSAERSYIRISYNIICKQWTCALLYRMRYNKCYTVNLLPNRQNQQKIIINGGNRK